MPGNATSPRGQEAYGIPTLHNNLFQHIALPSSFSLGIRAAGQLSKAVLIPLQPDAHLLTPEVCY